MSTWTRCGRWLKISWRFSDSVPVSSSISQGVDVTKYSTFALAVLLFLIPSAAAIAQNYPLPAPTPGTVVNCATCPAPYTGLPTWPYKLPMKAFTGRFVDSQNVRNFQGGSGLRTLRARGTIVAPELDKIYIILGQGLAAYKMSTFFTTRLATPMISVNGVSREGYYEQFLPYDWYAYAEGRNSGWVTKVADGQDRLFAADYDDRGNVYLAYQLFGWGIVKDSDGKLIKQVTETEGISPLKILTLKSGSKYYALVNGGSYIGLWETTNPASPVFIRKWRGSVMDWQKTAPNGLIAILSAPNAVDIYAANGIVTGAAPVTTITPPSGMSFAAITSDGNDLYAGAEASKKDVVITKISGTSLIATPLQTSLPMDITGMSIGGGIFTVWGADTATGIYDVRLARLENGVPREMPLDGYFAKYFISPPAGYARPAGYASLIPDSRVVHSGGKDYLIHSQYAFGDVFELQTRDSISVNQLKSVHGSPNPYSTTRTTSTIFYGDPLRFTSSTSGQTPERIRWNFDNGEAPAGPVLESTTGVDVNYQYVGIKTDADIERLRTVYAEVTTDTSNNATVKVSMTAPTARVGVKNTNLLFLQPNASATAPIVLGNEFVDSSDGSIEGHYSVWTLDGGTPVFARPDAPLAAGGCGAHSLAFEAHYVPYTDGTPLTPTYSDTYALIRTISPLTYTVKPFAAAIQIGTPAAGTIPFLNKTAVGSASAFAGGTATPVTVTWTLLNGTTVVDTSGPRSLTLATLATDVYNVASNLIPAAGGTVTLSVEIAPSAIADATCSTFASSSAEVAVKAPDPKFTISTCTNVGSPCKFTAGSVSNADMSSWKYKWKIDGIAVPNQTNAIFDMGSLSKTYLPLANKAYTISLEVTNAVDTRSASQQITLLPALCSGAPKGATIGWSGATSGCTTGGCTTNEPIDFNVTFWGYTVQDCDDFEWNFGDGTAVSTERRPRHTFPGNGPFTVNLTVKNSDGQTTAQTTVQFGTVTPPPPGCPSTAPGTLYVDWKGSSSGCDAINKSACNANESIAFTAAFFGYTVQSCDSISWNFGNTKTASGKNVSTFYTTPGTYTISATITNSKGSKTGRATITVGNGTPPPTCPDTAPGGNLGLEWTGQTSGCKTGTSTANCMPGETLNFQLWLIGYSQQTCDTFEWDFGDGAKQTTTGPSVSHAYGSSVSGSVNVSVTVRNSKGTKSVTKPVFFGTSGDCSVPVINLTGPGRAGVGKAVSFSGAVSPAGIDVVGWNWTITPGNVSKQGQTMSHTFNVPGTYDVKLTVRTGCAKEESKILKVVVADNSYAYLLPAVAHLELPSGTWKTDVQIFVNDANLASQPIDLTAEWNGQTKNLQLSSSTVIYEDFMRMAFPDAGIMASGAVVIRGASDIAPQIWTRTYIVPTSGQGSYGQLIPAIPLNDDPGAVTDPPAHILAGLMSSTKAPGYRTNIGVINPTNKLQLVKVELFDSNGFAITLKDGSAYFIESVNPYTLNQVNVWTKLPTGWNDDQHYSAKITTASGDPVFAYASTVDNTSNDPVYQSAVSDAAVTGEAWRKQVVVGVGHFNTWRSDVTIFNADSGPIQVDLKYYDQSGTKLAEALNVVIPARTFQHIEGLLRAPILTPPQTADSYGTLYVETKGTVAKFPMVFARTYNDLGVQGTYGQGIAAFASAEPNVTATKAAIVPGVRAERFDPDHKGYYTNIGLLNLTDQPTQVKISLRDEISGAEIGTETFTLTPNQTFIRPHVIEAEHPVATRGSVKIEVLSGGPVWAFASIIDNVTKDAEYVPAVPLP